MCRSGSEAWRAPCRGILLALLIGRGAYLQGLSVKISRVYPSGQVKFWLNRVVNNMQLHAEKGAQIFRPFGRYQLIIGLKIKPCQWADIVWVGLHGRPIISVTSNEIRGFATRRHAWVLNTILNLKKKYILSFMRFMYFFSIVIFSNPSQYVRSCDSTNVPKQCERICRPIRSRAYFGSSDPNDSGSYYKRTPQITVRENLQDCERCKRIKAIQYEY